MQNASRRRWAVCALLAATAGFAPGCVFQDIHDELTSINANMKVTQDILLDANATLDDVRTQLNEVQRTNELLVSLQAGLGTEGLAAAQQQNRRSIIGTMERIDVSLAQMDEHLTALRKTISNIDNTIPFLKFAAEEDEEEGEGAEGEAPGAPDGENADAPTAANGSARGAESGPGGADAPDAPAIPD